MDRIFGFDIGTTSIGFAAIDYDKDRGTGRILRMGVRIFPEARDPDGTPHNQTRRAKRMARRQLRRRKQRRRQLNETLAAAGLLPAFTDELWRTVMAMDPYALRDRGLFEPLTPHEFGRALYHLAKRRHFKGRDFEEKEEGDAESPDERTMKESPDEKAAKSNRDATLAELKTNGATLGQWLAHRPAGERKRGFHATRDVVRSEFDKLWTAQAEHHPVLKNDELRDQIADAMFAQRPVFWRKSTLGHCRFEPGAPLCLKGSWLSQQRRMLEKLNNLAIAGGNGRELDPEERAAILVKLQCQASMSWGGVRDALKPLYKARGESTKSLRFNLEFEKDSKGLLGNSLEQKLVAIFGDTWAGHPQKERLRREIAERVWNADYGEIGKQRVVILSDDKRRARRATLRDGLMSDFAVTAEQAAALADMRLPTGWEPYSISALERMLPKLERGVRFGSLVNGPECESWRDTTFPNRERPSGEFHDRLPSPVHPDEAHRIAQLRNPTVVRAQNELRKVVNNLIDMFGKPDLVRIELARDVGKSKREREEIKSALRKQEWRRRNAERDLQSKGINVPSRGDIEKWLLWKECQEQCPYTGDHIGFDDLFRNNRYQVEHIWPRHRSLDDSFRNKTLCRIDVNIAKGDKTPFEHFKHRKDAWEQIKQRLDKLMGKDGMSPGKVKRFLAETLPDDFAARQLNDTGYAARQAIGLLKKLWPDAGPTAPVMVQAVNGRVTAQLRKRWGLNNILADDGEKTRADHRHHAIDALTVACAHGGYAQRLAAYFKEETEGKKPHLPEPWPTIRRDAEAATAAIIVSHRVRKKVSGPLHKETIYGDTGEDIIKDRISYRVIVQRVAVTDLSTADLQADDLESGKFVIRDPIVREVLRKHVTHFGGDIKSAMASAPKLDPNGPIIQKVRLISKRQIDGLEAMHNGLSDPESKHHIAIYQSADGAYEAKVVSLFDAARRIASRQPIVARTNESGSAMVMSLAKGDVISFNDERSPYWVVRELKSNGQITLVPHTEARPTKQAVSYKPTASGLMALQPKKFAIDPIGRIRPAGD